MKNLTKRLLVTFMVVAMFSTINGQTVKGTLFQDAVSTGDWSIGGSGENLEIREPEQSNKVWATFQDDWGLKLTGAPNLEVGGDAYLLGKVYIGSTDTYFYRDAANRIKTDDMFYVGSSSPATYLYSAHTYLGYSGDKTHLRGNVFDWSSGGGGYINSSGNVGIGISSYQTAKLYVKSGAGFSQAPRFSMSSSSTSLSGINTSFSLFNTNTTTNNWARMHFATKLTNGSDADMVAIAVQYKNRTSGSETADFVVATTGSGTYSEKFRITGNGDVGIGTSNPKGHKLAVKGDVIVEEIWVKPYGEWHYADYVFEADYELKSLEEVELFIEENGHLPNVPNEAHVKEVGINLHEMDVVLLQKVEELTLYLIEQNKKIEELQKENDLLQKLILNK